MFATDLDGRAAFIDGLLALACFLEAHPAAPVPPLYNDTVLLHVFPDGDTDDERRALVDSTAAALGTSAEEYPAGSGHYLMDMRFGPVTYRVVAIARDHLAAAAASLDDTGAVAA